MACYHLRVVVVFEAVQIDGDFHDWRVELDISEHANSLSLPSTIMIVAQSTLKTCAISLYLSVSAALVPWFAPVFTLAAVAMLTTFCIGCAGVFLCLLKQ